ncbi:hypothetical protein DRQ18_06030 [bacterium]|nr:MAG: hypothetical protein DRQ18_06030 [bacterium]
MGFLFFLLVVGLLVIIVVSIKKTKEETREFYKFISEREVILSEERVRIRKTRYRYEERETTKYLSNLFLTPEGLYIVSPPDRIIHPPFLLTTREPAQKRYVTLRVIKLDGNEKEIIIWTPYLNWKEVWRLYPQDPLRWLEELRRVYGMPQVF